MAALVRVSISGQMPSGEEWSVNPVYAIGGDFGVPATFEELNAVAELIVDLDPGASIRALNVAQVTWTEVRLEARALNGTLEAQGGATFAPPPSNTGTSAHPFQTALCVSLRTNTPGASGRGRIYWPATGQSLGAGTLRLAAGVNATLAAAFQTYLSAIETALESEFTGVSLVVWSRTQGALHPVTTVRVGDVLDAQNRRRDALVENYASVPKT